MTTDWLEKFKLIISTAGLRWLDQHTSVHELDDCTEIAHEWWKDDRAIAVFERKITIYEPSESDSGELIKCWGVNIHTDMESISLDDDKKLIEAWKWLLGV